jgi:hypothetical protein
LPSVRALAMLALLGSILRPAVVRPRTSSEAGAIVLLIDCSKSMSVTDASRSPEQLVALADGLGLLPNVVRPHLKLDLAAAHDAAAALTSRIILARGELDYARISGQGTEAAQLHLSDAAASAKDFARTLSEVPAAASLANRLGNLADDVDRPSDEWTREIAATSNRLIAALERAEASADQELFSSDPKIQATCEELASMSRFGLVETALLTPKRGLIEKVASDAPIFAFGIADDMKPIPLRDQKSVLARLPAQPDGRGTDLSAALRAVREKMEGQPVQAIVLFSDGRQIGGDSQLTASLSAVSAPVFTVSAAAPVKRDVAVAQVIGPHTLLAGQNGTVRAQLHVTGFAGTTIGVTLECDGRKQTHRFTPANDDEFAWLQFPLTDPSNGVHTIRVFVDPFEGETCVENNSLAAHVNVISQKVHALLAGSGQWDYQYLRNILARSPWVELQEQILADDAARLAAPPDQILGRDVLIFSDVHASSLSGEQWQAVVKLVSERGGSVILVPTDAKQLMLLAGVPGVAGLLPMRNPQAAAWRTWSGDDPAFRLAPPDDSIEAMKLADDPVTSRRRWSELPAFFRFMPVADPKPAVRPLLVERDLGLPVLTEARVGAGRAFFFGCHETWRWRGNVGERDQDRFWSQLIRYACEEPYAVHDGPVALAAEPMVAEPRQPIRVRAKVLDEGKDRSIVPTLTILKNGINARTQVLLPAGAVEAGRFESIVDDLPEGEYEFRLSVNNAPTSKALKILIKDTFAAEMSNIAGDEARLRRIATASGGEMLRLEQIDELPAKIRAAREKQTQFVEYPLWDSPYLFALVLGCLGTEWALRKHLGLA